MKKRVIYFTYSAIPSFTANSIAVVNFCYELSKLCDLTLVAIKNSKMNIPYEKFYNTNKFKVILLPSFFLDYNYFFYKIYAMILCLIKKADFVYSRDIVISNFISKTNFNNIFEIHQIKQKGNNYYTNNYEKMLYEMHDRKSLKKIVCISESLKKECLDFGIDSRKLSVAHSGVRNDFFIESANNNKKQILYLGSLQQGKGIDNIIKLSQSLDEYNFIIIGGSNDQIDFLPNNVKHLKWIQPSQILNHVKDIQYAIMLFDEQDYKFYSPLKLFEYLAMGKIIIASNIEGINEIIFDNYNGILVNPSNILEIINKIKKIDCNNDLKNKISSNAKFTAKKYTWSKRAKFVAKLMEINK